MDLVVFRKRVDIPTLAIRYAGLIPKIWNAGYGVIDYGDVEPLGTEDEGNTHMRYEKEINDSYRRLYDVLISSYRDGRMPLSLV